jgi:hypothetical protein
LSLLTVAASGGDIDIRPDAIVVENTRGLAGAFLGATGKEAFTLGHFVFAERELSPSLYEHELVHVEQYENFGAAFLPLYGLAQFVAVIASPTGTPANHYYNLFESDRTWEPWEDVGWWR